MYIQYAKFLYIQVRYSGFSLYINYNLNILASRPGFRPIKAHNCQQSVSQTTCDIFDRNTGPQKMVRENYCNFPTYGIIRKVT